MKSDNHRRQFATIVAVIGVVYVMSQFFRMSNGVIAKELSAEFSLSAEALGGLTARRGLPRNQCAE